MAQPDQWEASIRNINQWEASITWPVHQPHHPRVGGVGGQQGVGVVIPVHSDVTNNSNCSNSWVRLALYLKAYFAGPFLTIEYECDAF